jgi:hypothetical protein
LTDTPLLRNWRDVPAMYPPTAPLHHARSGAVSHAAGFCLRQSSGE